MIPFSEISKVKYNVAKGGSGTIHLGAWRNMHIAIKEQHNTNDLIKEVKFSPLIPPSPPAPLITPLLLLCV
jgi:predicted Ser/Thr protein kinase